MISTLWVSQLHCHRISLRLMLIFLCFLHVDTADVIQPRLDQLNPSFDDFIYSLDMMDGMHCLVCLKCSSVLQIWDRKSFVVQKYLPAYPSGGWYFRCRWHASLLQHSYVIWKFLFIIHAWELDLAKTFARENIWDMTNQDIGANTW